jgi:predicted Zn-dependent protease
MQISVMRTGTFLILALFTIVGLTQSCAPRPLYRMPQPPSTPSSSVRVPPPAAPPIQESARKPLPQEPNISEQDLKSRTPPPAVTEAPKQAPVSPDPPTTPLADDSSLLAKITPTTVPQRAASLRLTEDGRKLLEVGDSAKALTRLEKTIVIDSTNPYGYFYLAKAHYQLGRYKESLSFLEVAESRLSGEPFWLAEVHALRGENFRALGMVDKAESSYAQALRLNSGNRTASDALPRLPGQNQIPSLR